MDTQFSVEYEVIDAVTNESFVTRERYEALACYRAGDLVYETHKTITQSSQHTQLVTRAIMRWNNNPDFREEE